MKQLSFSLLILVTILLAGSCKKVVQSNWTSSKITFKVDGTAKEAKGDKYVVASYMSTVESLQIIGNVNGSNQEVINLSIKDFKGVGEYADEFTFFGSYSTALDLESTYMNTSGKIKITSVTETSIKGEFEFVGQRAGGETNKVITEGKFESKLFRM